MAQQNKESLQQYYEIVCATIDYLIAKHGGSFVTGNEDFIITHYEQQRAAIQNDYTHGRLAKLQQRLAQLTKALAGSTDLQYGDFIKEKTGYNIDIFEDLRKRVNPIVTQNKISSKKELDDVASFLQYMMATAAPAAEIERMKLLLAAYLTGEGKVKYRKIIDHDQEGIIIPSPDGLKKLAIHESKNEDGCIVSVSMLFTKGASGGIYAVKGSCPVIIASWQDNSIVLICTEKAGEVMLRHHEIKSGVECIRIHYRENNE